MSAPRSSSAPDVRSSATAATLCDELASLVLDGASAAIAARGVFHIALSGGSLPAMLGRALAGRPIDASNWHIWFADERCVTLADPDSNYAEAKKHVLGALTGLQEKNVHAIDESKLASPKEAAVAYESVLRSLVPTGSLDLVLLGMGPDGHTCSLFPGHALLDERSLWIASIEDSPKPPSARITFTLPLLALAKASVFVLSGAGKADTLSSVISQRVAGASKDALPSALVQSQQVIFLSDADAAAKLPPQAQQQQNKL